MSTTDTEDTGYEFAYIESISSGAWHPEFIDHTGKKPEKRGPSVDTLTVRNAKWRFTLYTGEWSGTPGGELYDLEDDPNEFVNRWEDAAYQKVRSELTVVLLNRLAATRDPLPQRTKPF